MKHLADFSNASAKIIFDDRSASIPPTSVLVLVKRIIRPPSLIKYVSKITAYKGYWQIRQHSASIPPASVLVHFRNSSLFPPYTPYARKGAFALPLRPLSDRQAGGDASLPR